VSHRRVTSLFRDRELFFRQKNESQEPSELLVSVWFCQQVNFVDFHSCVLLVSPGVFLLLLWANRLKGKRCFQVSIFREKYTSVAIEFDRVENCWNHFKQNRFFIKLPFFGKIRLPDIILNYYVDWNKVDNHVDVVGLFSFVFVCVGRPDVWTAWRLTRLVASDNGCPFRWMEKPLGI
jgi:hypothetical protein